MKQADRLRAYVGTYTRAGGKGIHLIEICATNGELVRQEIVGTTPDPSYLSLHPTLPIVYATNELREFHGQACGAITVFRSDPPSGRLTLLSQRPSLGKVPAHVTLSPTATHALVANYRGPNIAAFRLGRDGSLEDGREVATFAGHGSNPTRQEMAHPHCLRFDPKTGAAWVPDLGTDRVFGYTFDAKQGRLDNFAILKGFTPGSGPRHIAFHPVAPLLYVLGELASTISVFGIARESAAKPLQTVSTLPTSSCQTNIAAEIAVHPSGRWLYASNRGHDSIARFSLKDGGARLHFEETVPTRGKTPRHFAIHPSGRWLLVGNQDSGTLQLFCVSDLSGELSPFGAAVNVEAPACVKFAADVTRLG